MPPRTPPAPRPYDNRLREQQAEATRERILEAVVELMAADGAAAFSVGRVAKIAGVSEPTIYRHFGSREGLIEAWTPWFEQRAGHPGMPKTLEELLAALPKIYAYFSANADLMRASHSAEAADLIQRGRTKRRRELTRMLAPLTEGRDPAVATAIHGLLMMIVGSQTWKTLCDDGGIPHERAAEAVEWALRTLVAALQHEPSDTKRTR